jgi:hypothetical protein
MWMRMRLVGVRLRARCSDLYCDSTRTVAIRFLLLTLDYQPGAVKLDAKQQKEGKCC